MASTYIYKASERPQNDAKYAIKISDQTKTFLICKNSFIYFIQDNRLAAYKQN